MPAFPSPVALPAQPAHLCGAPAVLHFHVDAAILEEPAASKPAHQIHVSQTVAQSSSCATQPLLCRPAATYAIGKPLPVPPLPPPHPQNTETTHFLVVCTSSEATIVPASSSARVTGLLSGTASTQRAGLLVALLYCSSHTSTTSAPFSTTQSCPQMPAAWRKTAAMCHWGGQKHKAQMHANHSNTAGQRPAGTAKQCGSATAGPSHAWQHTLEHTQTVFISPSSTPSST